MKTTSENLRTAWVDDGIVSLAQYGDPGMWDALHEEGMAGLANATDVTHQKLASRRDGSFTSPQQFHLGKTGPVITSLLRSRELLEIAREATGLSRLVPARSGYNYYNEGDFLGIHRDVIKCSITFTCDLTGNIPGMSYRSDLRNATNQELAGFVKEYGIFPEESENIVTPYRGLLGFDGYNIPHWRKPFPKGFGLLGTLCFFDL